MRLKQRLAEKVACCKWRSNPPDLTLIHGRGMTATQVVGERAGTMAPKKGSSGRVRPSLRVIGSSAKGAVDYGAGLPGT